MFRLATGQWSAPNEWILPRLCTRANRVRVHCTSTFNLVRTVKRCMRLWTQMLAKTGSTTPALACGASVARKLLVILWYLLNRQESYNPATDEDLAYKMLTWAWHMDKTALRGLTNQQFAKYGL
jgi:hypothetical protein